MHKSRPTCYIAYMHKAHHWQLSLILFLAKIWWGNSWSVPTAAAVLFGVVTCVFKTSRGEPLVKLRNNPSTFSRSSNLKCSFLLGDFLGPDWEKTVNKNHNGKSDLDGTFSLSDTDLEISDVETPNLFSSSEEEPPPDPSVFCKRIPENTRDLPVCDQCFKDIDAGEVHLIWTTSSGQDWNMHEGCCVDFAKKGPLGDIHLRFASTLCDHHSRSDPSVFKNVNLLVDALLASELEQQDSCPQHESSSGYVPSEAEEDEVGATLVVSEPEPRD